MAYDLLLTNSGDISFIASNSQIKKDSFVYEFHVASSDSLLMNFSVENYLDIDPFSNKELKMKRVSLSVNDKQDLDSIENAEVNMRVYVKNENAVYEITNIIEEDNNKILEYRQLEASPILNIDFYTYTLKNDKVTRDVYEKNYIEQAIRLRLDTEVGSIRGNESMGGDLFKFIHSSMQSTKLLNNICIKAKQAISDILPDCKVNAYIINNDYLNYHDSVKLVIINNEEVYYYYV